MAQNTLFILTDQWPAWAFGFLGADIPTPNIDRLASQDAYVSLLDIGETLFSLIRAESSPDQPREGRNLLPLVGTQIRPSDWPQIAHGVYYRYNGYSFEVRAIRNERYKYVWNPQDIDEFYDLQTDPHEMKNLSGQPQIATKKRPARSTHNMATQHRRQFAKPS